MDLLDELFAVTEALRKGGVRYALCGGLAVVIHGYPRLTQDIDFLAKEVDLERIQHLLLPLGYSIVAGIIPFDVGTDKERRIFRISKIVEGEVFTIDFILTGSLFEEIWLAREQFEVQGRKIIVVSLDGLREMKRLAGRLRDQDDLEHLPTE